MLKKHAFTIEFKHQVASLVLDQNYSCAQAFQATAVCGNTVQPWVIQLPTEREGITPKNKAITTEQQRIQLLEKRINRLEMGKDILKKAATS